MHLKNAGVGSLLVARGGPEVEGTGDVGGAAVVLPAAVHEQHACVVDGLACFWLRPAALQCCVSCSRAQR